MITFASRTRAALAPVVLALAYTAVVVGADTITVNDILRLEIAYARRIIILLFLIPLALAPLYLLVKLLRRQTAESPIGLLALQIRKHSRPDRLLAIAVPALLLTVLLPAFSLFKQRVLPKAGFGWDPALATADRMLFFGQDPWLVSHILFPGEGWSRFFDIAYTAWFVPLFLSLLLSWMAPLKVRTQYLLAFTSCWIIVGTLMALLLPSAGPCYFETFHGSREFGPLVRTLQAEHGAIREAGALGIFALVGQQELLADFHSRELTMASGISAMPSMHNALAALFACGAFAIHRVAGIAMSLFALIIWIGSIHLGWHYAVDGLVGAAASLLIWRACGSWAALLVEGVHSRPAEPAGVPAPAWRRAGSAG